MPFKSKAQRRKFAELLVKGEISDETFEDWNRETGRKELPERVTPARTRTTRRTKQRTAKKATRKTTRKTTARKASSRRTARKGRR